MERIALEVDDRVAKAWKEASVEKKSDIANKIIVRIAREFFNDDKEAFMQYLEQLRNDMAEQGLKQELLDDILR